MAEENRRMDLNLYLGLPRRRTESSDLGSDLALGSIPLSEEMSSSNTQGTQNTESYPVEPVELMQGGDGTEVVTEGTGNENGSGSNQDPYLTSFVPSSSPPLNFGEIGVRVPEAQQTVRMYPHVMEGSSSNHVHLPYQYGPRPVPVVVDEVQEESNRVPNLHAPARGTQTRGVNMVPVRVVSDAGAEGGDVRQFLPEFRFRNYASVAANANANANENMYLRMRRVMSGAPSSVNPDWARTAGAAAVALAAPGMVPDAPAAGNVVPEKPKEVAVENAEQNDENDLSALAANFECNVCLDMAKEPVVTSCGHLFCWPCLFQWLHVHSHDRECPVCKGEVNDADITPIYGRGNSEKEPESAGKEVDTGLRIPPRPQGRRAESERQRMRRPFSRVPREEVGSWSFIFDDMLNRGEEPGEAAPMLRSYDGPHRRMLSRLMAAQRFHWEDGFDNMLNFAGSGSSSNAGNAGNGNGNEVVHVESHFGPIDPSTAPMIVRRGLDFWRRVTDRFIPMPADPANGPPVLGADTGGSGGNNSGASGSTSANPRPSRPRRVTVRVPATALPTATATVRAAAASSAAAGDQASASSTAAVIQGEPSSVGSARTLRRSRRYTPSGSLDGDAVEQASNRRRLN